MSSIITIKNMVCPRCIAAVGEIFNAEGLRIANIELGFVEIEDDISKDQWLNIDKELNSQGFSRIDDKKSQLLEQIKTKVIDLIHYQDQSALNINWSDVLADHLNYDYHYLSTLFSSVIGITLEQFVIRQKIEKVKEFLIYDQLSVKEIAFKMGYSSVAHLSAQFKKVTGMTPSIFKGNHTNQDRKSLDNIL